MNQVASCLVFFAIGWSLCGVFHPSVGHMTTLDKVLLGALFVTVNILYFFGDFKK